ncbi:MAG: SBBP repeat-containing protein [Bryobacteraceae bacterium]
MIALLAIALAIPLLGAAPTAATPYRHPQTETKETRTATRILESLPIRFEANQGQLHQDVRFYSRFAEQMVFVTDRETLLSVNGRVLRMRPIHANSKPLVEGQEALSSRAAYFSGNRPSEWNHHVRQYGSVRYHEVYPGIDLVYRGRGKQLEYDFIVGPGADPKKIRMEFNGAEHMALEQNGTLVLELGGVEFRQPKPFVYQRDDANAPVPVEGAYRVMGRNQVSFQLGSYDRSKELIIDPVVVRSTYVGGSNFDIARAAAIDSEGKLWVTGTTTSPDFPVIGFPHRETRVGRIDVFVARFNPALSGAAALEYSTYIGGDGDDRPEAIIVASPKVALIIGSTTSTNYPVRNGYQVTLSGTRDMFLSQVNLAEQGDASLGFSTLFGGKGDDYGTALAIGPDNHIFAVGYTTSGDLPQLGGPVQGANRGGWEGFLVRFDPNRVDSATGIYSTYFGGPGADFALGVAVESQDRVWFAGYTFSPEYPISDDPYQPFNAGRGDLFLTRLDLSRSGLAQIDYSTYLGGTDYDKLTVMRRDSSGKIYLSGYTYSTDFPLTGNAYQRTIAGNADVFLVVFDPAKPKDQQLVYSTFLGGGDDDVPYGLALDSAGRVIVSGYTFSADFPILNEPAQAASAGYADGFVAWFDPNAAGSAGLRCSTYLGASGNEIAYGVVSDGALNTYVAGSTNANDFRASEGAFQTAYAGLTEAFLVRLSPCPLTR